MYFFRSLHRVESLNAGTKVLKIDQGTGSHSKYQFRIIANHNKDVGTLVTRHEVQKMKDYYYFEVPVGYTPLSELQYIEEERSKQILSSLFKKIESHAVYKFLPGNLVVNPDFIYINENNDTKFIYVPIHTTIKIENKELLRVLLLTLCGTKLIIQPDIFKRLINLTCTDNNIFRVAKKCVQEYALDSNSDIPIYTKFSIFKFIKDMFIGRPSRTVMHRTTLYKNPIFQNSDRCKFIDDQRGEWHIKHGDSIVGREESCEIRVNSPLVSRKHLAIHEENNIVQIKDLNSSNGTYINGLKMKTNHWYILNEMDKVELGGFNMWFQRIS